MLGCGEYAIASIGVAVPERLNGLCGSATDGDCRGDCTAGTLRLADASVMSGGSNGVVAKFSSTSS